jgi:hypothetical protein
MPNIEVQARDETAHGALDYIARQVEASFTATTATQTDKRVTSCLAFLDPVYANNSPTGVGIRTKPRFTQMCPPHDFELAKAIASACSETHDNCIVHTAAKFTALISRSRSAPHPIHYTKNSITAGHKISRVNR